MIPAPVGLVLLTLGLVAGAPAVRTSTTVQVAAASTTVPALTAPAWAHCGEWWQLAHDVGWPDGELPTVDRVMWCESRCTPSARNRSGSSGLMQVMPMHWHGRDPLDPSTNLTMALEIRRAQGWRAWSCW